MSNFKYCLKNMICYIFCIEVFVFITRLHQGKFDWHLIRPKRYNSSPTVTDPKI